MIDRILRADDQKRRRERVRLAVDRHAAFGHRFQQRRLRARRGAIDFIGQHDLRENRPRPKFELGRFLIEDRNAGHIGRQQIGRALNSLEGAADAGRQRAGEHRFRDARHVFQQNVPFGKPGHERQNDLLPFADDRLLDIGDDFLRRRRDFDHVKCPRCSGP